ncbi:MAG: hypothetical protein KKG99_07425 [Bacteroidetes bacterium]|nr:hypothetical protein [Bacteroidota bacterium]
MKKQLSALCFLVIVTITAIAQEKDFPKLTGSYLGQKPPGMKPEIFAPGVIPHSTGLALGLNMLDEGTEFYYSQWEQGTIRIRDRKLLYDVWTQDTIAPFSGKYRDWDLTAAPNGQRLYFTSNRPIEKNGVEKSDADIWYVERKNDSWSEAKWLGEPVNSDSNEIHPSIAQNGNLYFFGRFGPNICVAKYEDGHYEEPEKLGDEINSEYVDIDPFVAPDESFLIFHSNRPGGLGGNDLYISFRDFENDKWMKAVNMGAEINTENSDYCARISTDGKYLFFSRRNLETGEKKFYWIDAKFIEDLRKEALKNDK